MEWFFLYLVVLLSLAVLVRRLKLWLHNGEIARPEDCDHEEQFPMRWTQDGWVTICKTCGTWLYHGDHYDADV